MNHDPYMTLLHALIKQPVEWAWACPSDCRTSGRDSVDDGDVNVTPRPFFLDREVAGHWVLMASYMPQC
eukprot:768022-Hanusia_phi.AAC.3